MRKVTHENNENLDTFEKRLKDARTELNLSQKELAEKLFIKREYIVYYENGDRKPDFDKLLAIANELNISLDYLLCRTNSKDISNNAISKRVGLSDKAIEKLSKMSQQSAWEIDILNDDINSNQYFPIIINKIIENQHFEKLIYFIRKYINSFKKEELKKERELKEVLYIDEDTGKNITKKDLLSDAKEEGIYDELYEESSTDIYAYKINSVFNNIVNTITEQLKPSFSKKWILNEEGETVPICNDCSEKNKMLKGYKGVKGNGSSRNNKK